MRQLTINTEVVDGDIPNAFHWDVRQKHIEESLVGYRPREFSGEIAITGRREYIDIDVPLWAQLTNQSPIVVELENAIDHDSVRQGVDAESWMRIVNQWQPRSRA